MCPFHILRFAFKEFKVCQENIYNLLTILSGTKDKLTKFTHKHNLKTFTVLFGD